MSFMSRELKHSYLGGDISSTTKLDHVSVAAVDTERWAESYWKSSGTQVICDEDDPVGLLHSSC